MDYEAERVLDLLAEHAGTVPKARLVCVLQAGGTDGPDEALAYAGWAVEKGVTEICFKELYVSTTLESAYHDAAGNTWCLEHQTPLAPIVSAFLREGFKISARLPWGGSCLDRLHRREAPFRRRLLGAERVLGEEPGIGAQLERHGRRELPGLLGGSAQPLVPGRKEMPMTSPDFQGFLVERDLMLKDPRVFDAGETNLYRVLADLRPETPALGRRIHRCHLAGHWLDACGFPAEWGARAFASSGVRHALAILCAHWKETGTRILLPNDVYPAYWRIAGEAGVQTTPFSTWPRLDGRSLDGRSLDADADADADADVVLLCEPAKPRGRSLDAEETRILLAWLRGSPARRVALDAVYAEIPEFTKATRTLISTGQTLLLHSLSKGWLHPGTFGIALVPETDARILAKRFQTAEAPQESLAAAEAGRRHVKLFPRRPD